MAQPGHRNGFGHASVFVPQAKVPLKRQNIDSLLEEAPKYQRLTRCQDRILYAIGDIDSAIGMKN